MISTLPSQIGTAISTHVLNAARSIRAIRSANCSVRSGSRLTASTAFQKPLGPTGEPAETARSASSSVAPTHEPSIALM